MGDARPERDISVSIKHKVGNEMKNIFILWLNGLRTGGANRREGRGHKVWEGEGAEGWQRVYIKRVESKEVEEDDASSLRQRRHGASLVSVSSVAQSCPSLCDPMNCSTPGLPVHHHLPEFTQTHVHRVSDAIQASHPLWSPSPPAPNPSQHQSLFQ